MSLAIDGVWKAGVWATTVWADGVWREGAPAVVEAPGSTGGWGSAWQRYRDEDEVRRQRIALEIIPPDEPDAEAIKVAAGEAAEVLARRKIRRLERDDAELDRLERLTLTLMRAQREAQIIGYRDMIDALQQERSEAITYVDTERRNHNAKAVLVMLSML